jgi:hypothetical protein
MVEPVKLRPKRPPPSGRILVWWFAAMSAAGVLFGAFAEQRPFGDDVLGHPAVVLFLVVGIGLLVLRFAMGRPVQEIIPDRLLVVGCIVGLAAFLIGNWLAVHLRAL